MFFGAKILQYPTHISSRFTYEHVTFILLCSSLLLTSVLRLMIFHKLENISPVDQIFKDLRFYIKVYAKHLCHEIINFTFNDK